MPSHLKVTLIQECKKSLYAHTLEGVGLQEQRSMIKEGFHNWRVLPLQAAASYVSHPNIARFIGSMYCPKTYSNIPVMIMELMDERIQHRDLLQNNIAIVAKEES